MEFSSLFSHPDVPEFVRSGDASAEPVEHPFSQTGPGGFRCVVPKWLLRASIRPRTAGSPQVSRKSVLIHLLQNDGFNLT